MRRLAASFALASSMLMAPAALAQQPPAPPTPVVPQQASGSRSAGTMPPQAGPVRLATTTAGPRVVEWKEGDPIPAGYRRVARPRVGLIVAGGVVFGVGSSVSIAVGSMYGNAVTAIPAAGPFVGGSMVLAQLTREARYVIGPVFLVSGILQIIGTGMLIGGLSSWAPVLVRDEARSAKTWLLPVPMSFGPRGYGLGIAGTL